MQHKECPPHAESRSAWLTDILSPAQIAAVVGCVRTHFGNDYRDPVTAEQVSKLSGTPPKAGH